MSASSSAQARTAAPEDYEAAGLEPRFAALATDTVLLVLILYAPVFHWSGGSLLVALLMLIVITFAYFTVFVGSRGQTPGKTLVGVKVVSVSGGEVSFGAAALRWVGYVFGAIPLFAGFILALVREDRRALHDLLADTKVVSWPR